LNLVAFALARNFTIFQYRHEIEVPAFYPSVLKRKLVNGNWVAKISDIHDTAMTF